MNVTLAIDSEVVARARRYAERRGTTLNQVIRDYLDELTRSESPEATLSDLEALWDQSPGRSGGRPWTREELHDRALLR